jgi:hypothetical protein
MEGVRCLIKMEQLGENVGGVCINRVSGRKGCVE